jgi:hypothetical protein
MTLKIAFEYYTLFPFSSFLFSFVCFVLFVSFVSSFEARKFGQRDLILPPYRSLIHG